MGNNPVTEICFTNTSTSVEIGEYIRASECLLGRVDEKGLGKQQYGLL